MPTVDPESREPITDDPSQPDDEKRGGKGMNDPWVQEEGTVSGREELAEKFKG